MRQWLWGLLAGAFTIGLVAACGDGGLPDARYLIDNAAPAVGGITSGHVRMNADGPVAGSALTGLDADVAAGHGGAPGYAMGQATVVLDSGSAAVHFVERNGRLSVRGLGGGYLPAAAFLPSTGPGSSIPLPSTLLDPHKGLSHTLACLRDAHTIDRETIDGATVFRVIGTVPRDVVAQLLPGVDADARLTVWFAAAGRHLPVRTELTLPGTNGKPVTILIMVSKPNEKFTVPSV